MHSTPSLPDLRHFPTMHVSEPPFPTPWLAPINASMLSPPDNCGPPLETFVRHRLDHPPVTFQGMLSPPPVMFSPVDNPMSTCMFSVIPAYHERPPFVLDWPLTPPDSSQLLKAPLFDSFCPPSPQKHPASRPLHATTTPPPLQVRLVECSVRDCLSNVVCQLSPCGCQLCRSHLRETIKNVKIKDQTIDEQTTKKVKLFTCASCDLESSSAGACSTLREKPSFGLGLTLGVPVNASALLMASRSTASRSSLAASCSTVSSSSSGPMSSSESDTPATQAALSQVSSCTPPKAIESDQEAAPELPVEVVDFDSSVGPFSTALSLHVETSVPMINGTEHSIPFFHSAVNSSPPADESWEALATPEGHTLHFDFDTLLEISNVRPPMFKIRT
ncbi:hypothetical protein ACM66B_002365 [Microbotryomycetes sp. NB124-2]